MTAEGNLSNGQGNTTYNAHGTTEYTVVESLDVCQQMLESSWQRFNSVHSNKIWNDALRSAVKGCKGLLNLATERQFQKLEGEKELWFIMFLTFSGISLIAICAMLYLISSMRDFVSLKKCVLSRWESRETRPSPEEIVKTVLTQPNTRPMVKNSAWAKKDSQPSQMQAAFQGQPYGPSLGHSVQYSQNQVTFPYGTPGGYPVTVSRQNVQSDKNPDDNNVPEEDDSESPEAKTARKNQDLLAKLDIRFKEYQNSLWELQRANMPGLPQGIYPGSGDLARLEGEM